MDFVKGVALILVVWYLGAVLVAATPIPGPRDVARELRGGT